MEQASYFIMFYSSDVPYVLSIPLILTAREDSLFRFYDKKGDFSVRSAYKLAVSLSSVDDAGNSSKNGFMELDLES